MATTEQWAVVVPVKLLALAKSRLPLSPARRADLALAMACDVVLAARAAVRVDGVVAVTNDVRAASALDALGARVVADSADAGLDEALVEGARTARSLWPRSGVAALSGDLPCATAGVIDAALAAAAVHDRAVLPDRRDDGTTVLTAGAGLSLQPSYGAASRARHVLGGAHQIDPTGLERLRLDVDTAEDLAAAIALGVGPHTAAVMLAPDPR